MSNPTPADLWDSLAIVPSPQGRSRCVTTRPLAVRGTVLLSSVPMAAVLVDQAKGRRCDECLRPLGTAKGAKKTCSGCKEDVYCSVGCQTTAWTRHHKVLCRHLPTLAYKMSAQQLDEPTRLDTLLLARLAAEHFAASVALTPSLLLADMPDDDPPERLLPHELFLSLLSQPTPSPVPALLAPHLPPHLSANELALLLDRFHKNNHTLTSQDSTLETFANVVLAGVSRAVNHSCVPSGVMAYEWDEGDQGGGIRVGVRTIQPLDAGEELSITYLDPLLSRSTRIQTLQTLYDFTCTCPLCSLPPNSPRPRPFPIPPPTNPKLAYPDVPMPSGELPLSEEEIGKLTNSFAELAAKAGGEGLDEAARVGGRVLKIFWAGYGGYRPIIATHLLALANVELNRAIVRPPGDAEGRTCLARSAMFASWAEEVGRVVWGDSKRGDGAWEVEVAAWKAGLEGEVAAAGGQF